MTIQRQPELVNLVKGPNIWEFTGLTNESAYVIDVQIDGESVALVRQFPNPAGILIYDPSEIIESYMDSSVSNETIQEAAEDSKAAVKYRLRYGLAVSDQITWYGFTPVKTVFNGRKPFWQVDWVDKDNFIAQPTIVDCQGTNVYNFGTNINPLTYWPVTSGQNPIRKTYKVFKSDFRTISFVNFHQNFGAVISNFNRQPWAVIVNWFLGGSSIQLNAYALSEQTGLGPRESCLNQIPFDQQDSNTLIGQIGTGPMNLIGKFNPPAEWDAYEVRLVGFDQCKGQFGCNSLPQIITNSTGEWLRVRYELDDRCTSKFEPIQVSFLNSVAGWDYYTFIKRNTVNYSINKETYEQDPGQWSGDSFNIEATGRGTRQFSGMSEQTIQVSTDWLTDDVSKWMQELYLSPNVRVYDDGIWKAANVVDNRYEEKTGQRNNKLFRHTVNLKVANGIKIQRG